MPEGCKVHKICTSSISTSNYNSIMAENEKAAIKSL